MKRILVGTSGYNYRGWRNGVFYPKELPQKKWFEYYCNIFNSVELNVTFYRLPSKETFKKWHDSAPRDFVFTIKGSRYITHIKKLLDSQQSLKKLLTASAPLRKKLGCVLWQLPPGMKKNAQRISEFCGLLKKTHFSERTRHSFEFRHATWFDDEIYSILRKHNVSLCIADSPQWPKKQVCTADFIYLRFHGRHQLYGSNYSEEELIRWSTISKRLAKDKNLLCAFFNNDTHGFAPHNAQRFFRLLS